MERFDLANLDQTIGPVARDAMLDVILSWARFDSLISKWMSVAFGTSPDATVILMGNMGTQSKLTKLKALYSHFGFSSEAQRLGALHDEHGRHVEVRNTIAHVGCVGQIKRVKAMPGHTFVEVIHLWQMAAARDFALGACHDIEKIVEELSGAAFGDAEPA